MKKEYYELTAPQKSIWVTEQYYQNTNINNVCGTFYSKEKLDFELLKKSLNIFLKNNDSFKIKLELHNDGVKQYFSEIDDIDFEIADIKNKQDQMALEEKMASKVFTMIDSLLFEIVLFRYPDGHGGFVINSHHIISDSWTNGIVANTVALIYSKLRNNEEYIFDNNLSYKNYIQSELNYINSPKFEKDKAYWNEVFATVPEVATIPSIKDTSKNQDDLNANRFLVNIDEKLLTSLTSYCEKNKVSLYNFFMTVFSLYLGRVSNLDEFVIGTPILNRTNFKEKQTTGMFINTLPLKVSLSHDKTFLDNLKDIAISSMGLLRHQKYSFQYIIEDLRKRDPSLPRLYNVLYSYQITKMNENMESLEHTTSWIFDKTIADDLDIHMFEWNEDNSIQIAYDYRTSMYDEQDIIDLHARILYVINQILEKEDILLKDIEIVTPEEKHKILYEFNNTKVDYPKDKTIVDLFEEQVEKTPDNIAIVFEDQKLTYRELNEKANQLARYLISKNVEPKSVIGLRMNKRLEMIVGIISIIKSGCCYLPINMSYPKDRVDYMLKDSNTAILLSTSDCHIDVEIPTLNIDLNNTEIYQGNINNLNEDISPEDLIYIIYTSGSTGKPKGAMLCHRNVVRLMKNDKYLFDFNENDIWTMFHSVAFDFSVWEMYGALLYGGKLVLVPDDIAKDPNLFLKLLRKEKVTILNQTPTYFYNLLKAEQEFSDNNLFIRYIIFGGEALKPNLIKWWKEKYPLTRLINMYGITETTVHVTYKELLDSDFNYSLSNIGQPIPTLHVLILDKNLNLLPPNVEGEMCIVGDGVFKGYLNRPDLNAQKLVSIPSYSNNLIYKSADSAILHKDGNLEYIGRIDNQVKIRGFRVELGEIEEKILSYSNITDCIVCKRSDNNGRDILCAYYIKNAPIDIKDLKNVLNKDLPNYMIPQYFIEITKIPININGKTDFKALPLPEFLEIEKDIVLPRNHYDSTITSIYAQILGINTISIKDSFFELGGDSLAAINAALRISKELKLSVSVKDILTNPIIMDLSDYIHDNAQKDTEVITLASVNDYYPLSSAQKRIYYSCLKDKNSLLYNIAGGVVLDKDLNKEKLESCFKTLIKRHSSLRTYFETKENNIIQIIKDTIDFNLDFEKVNTDNINEIYSNFVKPFDLSKPPLFRVKLAKLKNNKELLLLDMHHIISDGTSLNILLQELCSLYNEENLSDKKIEYKDFTVWEQDQINSENFKKSKEFWVNQFQDEAPLLNMPTTYTRPTVQSFEGSNYYTSLDSVTYNKIIAVSKKLNITPYMLLLSVYYILLSKYTLQDDIIVGTPIIGRELPELSNLLGMFVNSLPIRNKINHSLKFTEFSSKIKENCLEAFKHQSYPFDMIVKDLDLKRDPSRNPLFDTMFIYQSEGYPTINFNGINSEYFIPENPISKFDLSLEIVPINNKYQLRFEYCTKLFDKDFIKRFSSHYINILNTILENNEIKIADIDILSEEEKSQILYEFNNTKVNYPKDRTIIDLFEEQVKKTPDNIAVVFEDQKLTYKELNEKANQLARFLLSNNANIKDMICILLDKSLEMIVSILGILKVGASFLPIDINYPKERIDYIINDSQSNLLLTTHDLVHKANETVQALCVELDNMQFSQYSPKNLDIQYSPSNLAYVMYTSGSTGNPKGVMVTHQNVIRLVKNSTFINFEKNEHILQTGSIVFDACTFEIWGALLNGYELYIIAKELLLDASYLKKYMKNNRITSLFITTQLFNQLVDSDVDIFSPVTNVLTGGEAVSVKHINKLNLYNKNINIIHCYGPTENTTFSTCYDVEKRNYEYTVPIGKPISNSTAYVVSPFDKLCPIGVPGELWVGGDGVAKGYLNNEKLTNEKFIKNPFSDGIIYKTGDLVKWLPDGNIEFIGRIDNQVKVRGFRIELSEIDTKILEYPDIKYSTTRLNVINGEKVICSYFVASKNIDINGLKEFLKRFLPIYMIPTYMLQLESFKMNTNGKIDKNCLPTDFNILKSTKHIELPQNDTEKKLLSIFSKVIHLDDISVTDNLFDDLHGDSLVAMKIQVEALSQNINIAYSDIFKYPTIRLLSNHLIKMLETEADGEDLSKMDFSKYKSILEKNSLNYPIEVVNTSIKNILLTGFTGFLGAHVLDSFIKKETGTIYCLIRSKNNISAKDRLLNVLHFYFEHKYDSLIGNRIQLIEGNISVNKFGLSETEYNALGNKIDTIIHCAALVKHYGMYKDFERANITGTQNVVDFAIKSNSRLLHVSTLSVSGNNFADGSNVDNHFGHDVDFSECDFYIGQNLSGIYAKTKFIAEKIVLDAVVDKNLNACILRMGNLTSRFSEGKFQQNHFENAFVNRFKSFIQIGYVPDYMLKLYAEFTPIDYCGDAIIEIAKHFNKNYTVFHLMNEKRVYLDRLFDMMHELNITLNIVSEKEFVEIINNLLADENKKMYIEGIINDFDKTNKHLVYESEVKVKCDFSKVFLQSIGFEWPYIDINYIRNYFKYLYDIGYFKKM